MALFFSFDRSDCGPIVGGRLAETESIKPVRLSDLTQRLSMALIRVTGSHRVEDVGQEEDIILNTRNITVVYPDAQKRGVWVRLTDGEPIFVRLSFDEMWMLIQRET
jgi:hypothetical protein